MMDISEVPRHRLQEIRRFFEDYKKNEKKEVQARVHSCVLWISLSALLLALRCTRPGRLKEVALRLSRVQSACCCCQVQVMWRGMRSGCIAACACSRPGVCLSLATRRRAGRRDIRRKGGEGGDPGGDGLLQSRVHAQAPARMSACSPLGATCELTVLCLMRGS